MMMLYRMLAIMLGLGAALAMTPAGAQDNDPGFGEGLEFRNLGPSRGGRVTAVAGIPDEPMTFYMGATGGGVWKTTNGGASWQVLSDESFNLSLIHI